MGGRVSKAGLVFMRLQTSDREETYSGLLWIAELRAHSHGWVAHKFKAIYGEWPRQPGDDETPVQPSGDLITWVGNERRKWGAGQARKRRKAEDENAAIASAALDRIEAILAELEANPLARDPELREEDDLEALDLAAVIEQRMAQNQ